MEEQTITLVDEPLRSRIREIFSSINSTDTSGVEVTSTSETLGFSSYVTLDNSDIVWADSEWTTIATSWATIATSTGIHHRPTYFGTPEPWQESTIEPAVKKERVNFLDCLKLRPNFKDSIIIVKY